MLSVKTVVAEDVAMSSPPPPTNLSAEAYNAKAVLYWDSAAAGAVNVYRSISQTGTYTKIGTTSETSYVDSGLTNGTTYWYKLAAINFEQEGALTTPVSATPISGAPVVTITSVTADDNGLMTIACSGSAAGDAVYNLVVDGQYVWSFNQSEAGSIVYDSTQLGNGTHTIEVYTVGASATGWLGMDRRKVQVNNYISSLSVPDDICGAEPITATFAGPTNWTLTCSLNGNAFYTTSGTGTSMNVVYDASGVYDEFDVIVEATPTSTGGMSTQQAETTRLRRMRGRWLWGSNPNPPFSWSSVYVDDTDTGLRDCFELAHNKARTVLFDKLGWTPLPIGMISQDTDWQDGVIDMILNGPEMPADIFVFAGHGVVGATNQRNPAWQSAICAPHMPATTYAQGSGLTAFVDLTPFMYPPGSSTPNGLYEALGPQIGNTITWDHTTGRYSDWNCTRRLKFVYLNACEAGKSIIPLAFGTPRGRYPGRGRAFLGFRTMVAGGVSTVFTEAFWNRWNASGTTVAQAASAGFNAALAYHKVRVDYVLHGDPNLRPWR